LLAFLIDFGRLYDVAVLFRNSIIAMVAMFSVAILAAAHYSVAAAEIVLTNAAQVRALTPVQAQEHFPARLRGVVISEAESEGDGLVMLDETAGIYLSGPYSLVSQLHRGDSIEAEGVCDPGEFAPLLLLKNFLKLGIKQIPKPRQATFEQMIGGGLDAQWVEVSGVVRRCEPVSPGQTRWKCELATGGGRLAVDLTAPRSPDALVDAEVRLRGICFSQVNRNRQLLSLDLFVPHNVPVTVERPAPTDPYARPVCPIGSLLQFAPDGNYGHRVHVRGVVTAYQPGKQLWIQDAERGLRVHTQQTESLDLGDAVEVLGFPIRGEYSPILENAVFRKSAAGGPPVPRLLKNLADAFNDDADLVQVEARLSEVQSTLDGCALFLTEGGESFKALLYGTGDRFPMPARWKTGSRLRLTGICSVIADQNSAPGTGVTEPQSFQMLLRSPGDVLVLNPAPWLNWKKAVWLLGAISFGLLLIVVAVLSFARRRLREQTVQRALAETELAAILKERNRMAREIHDTLAQGLGAISMQLELAKDYLPPAPDGAQKHLEQASALVRSSLADARNTIWNMRAQVLETGDLATALKGILQQLTDGTKMKFHLRVSGQPRRLAPLVENDLLRIGQEAITNAVRHAHPEVIFVGLEFGWKTMQLLVRDDGRGFDVANPPPSEGGFGLLGIRERVAQLGGQLKLQSHPDQGTEFLVTLPVPT
jgi:signal transduction histidine kinase